MTEKPTAGTIRLDGMLQGRVPDSTAVEELESWVASAKKSGMLFHLSLDGPNFSIVPDPTPQRTSRLGGPDLEALLSEALEALLSLLPVETRSTAFSTIRSEEFRPGQAIQTVYAVGPDGTINTEQRSVEIVTQDPPPELTPASIKRAILPALFFLVLALFISSFFIDYRKLWSEARDTVVPLSKEEVEVDQKSIAEYVTIELTGVDKGKTLHFKLSRGPKWDSAINSTPETSGSWSDFINRLAIHQGRLRVEFRNKEDKLLREGELNIDVLRKKKEAELPVAARFNDRLAKIVFRP